MSVVMDKRDSSYVSIGEIQILVQKENVILAKLIIEQNDL